MGEDVLKHHTKRTPVSRWNNAVIHAIMG